jgi:UDP-3-O-[3-hydroxymyristoyl] glucosamine N-acyltransferase
MKFTANQIAELVSGTIVGSTDVTVSDFSKIEEASSGTLTFLANPKYEEYIYATKASIALVNSDFTPTNDLPSNLTLIKVENAYESLAKLLQIYEDMNQQNEGIEDPVFIHPTAKIGKSVYIGAFSHVGANAVIGDNCQIFPHCHIGNDSVLGKGSKLFSGVKIYNKIKIGISCTIHSGAVIGSDGFGFAPNKDNEYQKVPQIGNVIICDHVEIGANTTIDRATMGSTIIGKGVKLDNLVQIAHNVEIGENTVIAAQTGVAGSTKIGRDVMIGGQVGIVGHIKIADGTKIAAQSGIGGNMTEENQIVQGSPAFFIGDFKRSYVLFKNLPELRNQIKDLEDQIKKLKQNV